MMYYSGRIHSVIYDDPSQAFYIVKMVLDGNSSDGPEVIHTSNIATVRGHIPGINIKVGVWFGFEGNWKDDPKYGKQLNITKAPVFKDTWDPDSVEQMLNGNGVAGRTVQQIRRAVGDGNFISCLSSVDELKGIGLDEFTATYVNQKWMSVQAYFKSLVFLNDLGLPTGKIRQVWSFFGDDSSKVLSTNPWALVQLEGITFQQADEIASRLHLNMMCPERIQGAIIYSCRAQQSAGHLFLPITLLQTHVQGLVQGAASGDIAQAIADLHKAGKIYVDRTCNPSAVYDIKAWEMESQSAVMLADRKIKASFSKGNLDTKKYIQNLTAVGPKTEKAAAKKRVSLDTVVTTAVREWGIHEKLDLSPNQQQGVANALKEPISILTGLPGTGKTTSLRAAVRVLQEAKVPFLLCAPTGIAAKNLSALTGAIAYTIHRAFAAKGSSDDKRESTYAGIVGDAEAKVGGFDKDGVWGYGEGNTHPAEVVIVDEASMMDQHLLYRILICTSPTCRLVFVGDAAQLPSVGPGNVLRDLIASDRFPVVHLTEIFRQKDTSGIVYASHAIHRGDVPDCDASNDFILKQLPNEETVLEYIKGLADSLYGKRANFQILSPRHNGTVGVTNLNTHLRELLNPPRDGLQELRLGEDTIREDDRIMVVKNDYKLGVYNGDVGKVSRVDRKAKEVELKIFGPFPLMIRVPFRDLGQLIRMAYACTVHKAQGLEYDYIVMPLVDGFRHQLQRNLLYTAVTRAKKKVVLVGTMTALTTAVCNDKEDLRNTMLKSRVQASIPA